MFQSNSKTALLVDQVEKQQFKYKRLSQDQSSRIGQLEESLHQKCSTIAKLTANLEMVQAGLRLAEGRVRELGMTARSREAVMDSLRDEWAQQEERMRSEHQVRSCCKKFLKILSLLEG